MKALSRRTRMVYLGVFIIIFFVSIPIAIFYAIGYRFSEFGGSLVPTGGVYVSVPTSGATVSLNGEEKGTTGLFNRGFYIDNLSSGSYAVHVSRDGSYPWYRTLVVVSGIVTDVRALLVPQQIEPIRLVRGTTANTSSTTRAVLPTQYDANLALFSPAKTTKTATTTRVLPDDTQGGFELFVSGGDAHVHWSQSTSTIPSVLCIKPLSCVHDLYLKKGKETITYARFWGGGVVYTTKESGIYLAEIDVRPTPLTVPLYLRPGAQFRLLGDSLLIKDASTLYQIDGF